MSLRHFVLVLIALQLAAVPVARGQAPKVYCGLGPPPDSPEFADYRRLQKEQESALGYRLVCDRDVNAGFGPLEARRRSQQGAVSLAFQPVSLGGTPFAAFEAIGQVADVSSPSGYTLLNRTFRTPSAKLINLREWDMSVSGGAVYPLDPAERREDVNGAPAQLTILQSPSGIAVSILTWIEGRREYQLMMDANVKAAGTPNLLELARSLPKSVPGGQLDGGFKGFPATWDGK
jgi:hypothetical protein